MPSYHPNRYNFSDDWEQTGYFEIEGNEYYFVPSVRDVMMFIRGEETGNFNLIANVLDKHDLTFKSTDEYTKFINYCFNNIAASRFPVNDIDSSKPTPVFDYFIDSDVIYSDFVKNYPFLVSSPKDLQEMNYWQFVMLFNNMNQTLKDRMEVRRKKLPKKRAGESLDDIERRRKLEQDIINAKRSIKIEKKLKFI